MRLKLDRQPESETCQRGNRAPLRPRAWLRLLVLFAGILLAACPATKLRAQPARTTDTSVLSSNRFLFIVDTSADMKDHTQEVVKTMNQIIISSADGQLRRGDTVGLWTFDKEVSSDLALQVWNPDEREQIASHTTDFLKVHPYSGPSHFDRVVPVMLQLLKHSEVITVIIISNGKDKFKGTTSDKEINDLYQKDLKETKGHAPITTVLQGRQGKLYQFTVNAPPWPVIIPAVPLPQPVARKAAPELPVAPVVKQTTGQPLILSGPRTSPDNTPPPAPVPVPVPVPVPQVAQTIPPPVVTPTAPVPSPEPAPVVATEQALATPAVSPPANVPPPPPRTPDTPIFQNPKPKPSVPLPEPPPPPLVMAVKPGAQPEAPAPVVVPPPPTVVVETPANAKAVTTPGHPAVVADTGTQITGRPKILLIAGVILAIVGFLLIILTVIRGRDTGPSLITRSMNDKNRG